MNKHQTKAHFISAVAFIGIIAIFWIWDGGTAIASVSNTSESTTGINTAIPSASKTTLADNKLEALLAEENRLQQENKRKNLEGNSFDLLSADEPTSENTYAENSIQQPIEKKTNYTSTAQHSSSSNTSKEKQHTKYYNTIENNYSTTEVDYERLKEEEMRRKVAEFETQTGVNMTEHGYTKYSATTTSIEQSTVAKNTPSEVQTTKQSGFHGLNSNNSTVNSANGVKAVIHGDHKDLTNNSIVKIRLLENLKIDNITIPKNNFIYGRVSFASGRLQIRCDNITYRNNIIPFAAIIYDRDGFEGIYVPDNKVNDASKQLGSDAIDAINVSSGVTGLVNTGISTVKTIVTGSIREQKVSITANYQILIKKQQ